MTHKTLKSDRLWKFSSAGRASALQAEGQRFEPVNFHQSSTYESKCFFFSLLQPDSSSANRQRVRGLSPVTHTNKRNPNLSPNGDGFGFTVIFMEKSKTEKPGGLLTTAILLVFFMQMHCLRLRFPLSDRQTPFLYDLPHFVFTLCDCCGIAAAIVNSLSTELNFGLCFAMGVISRFLNLKKTENFC